jgi:hypothetical protein
LIRVALLVCALWAIIAAPVLCTAGVLAHECECDEVCICDHESECEADPCSELLLRKDESGTDVEVPALAAARLVASDPESGDRMAAPPCPHPDRAPPLGVPHPSDLPLLS